MAASSSGSLSILVEPHVPAAGEEESGGEDGVNLIIEFDASVPPALIKGCSDADFQFTGLDTAAPRCRIGDVVLVGAYELIVGTAMIYDTEDISSSEKKSASLVGKSTRKLVFRGRREADET